MRASHGMDCISCVQRGARSHGLFLISALLYTNAKRLLRTAIYFLFLNFKIAGPTKAQVNLRAFNFLLPPNTQQSFFPKKPKGKPGKPPQLAFILIISGRDERI